MTLFMPLLISKSSWWNAHQIRRVGCLAHKLRRDARNLSCHCWFAVCCNTKKLVAPAILQSGEHFDDLLADIVCQVALKKW